MNRALATATNEPKKHQGVRAPLFDRFVEEKSNEFYTQEEVLASIQHELLSLLNTRTALKRQEYEELSKDEINFALPEMFGLPEFTMYDGMSGTQWKSICDTCAKAIAYFEPRLKNVQVSIEELHTEEQLLSLNISADLIVGQFQASVTFPVAVALSPMA